MKSSRSSEQVPETLPEPISIQFALLPLDLCEEAIKIAEVRHVFLVRRLHLFRSPSLPRPTPHHDAPYEDVLGAPSFTNYFAVKAQRPSCIRNQRSFSSSFTDDVFLLLIK